MSESTSSPAGERLVHGVVVLRMTNRFPRPACSRKPGGFKHSQYHLPRAKPPEAIRPTTTMITPIQKLQTIMSTIPTMTMIPPVDIRAIPARFSRSAMRCPFSADDARASTAPRRTGACRRMALHRPPSIRVLAARFYPAYPGSELDGIRRSSRRGEAERP